MMKKLVILVTGASAGIGNLTARCLAQGGHVVYASMRDINGKNAPKVRELHDWSFARGLNLRVLELDVLSQSSADVAAEKIMLEQGRIDVIVHNAGHLVVGPTEAFSPEEMIQVFDTNVLGAQRVNRAVLPHMRAQLSGLMLWVSSTTTRGGFPPFIGPYAAAKAAMDSIAVTQSYELARFGIETSIMVPGAFTRGTDHFPNAGKPADQQTVAAYARYDGLMDHIGARLAALSPEHADPLAVAEEMTRIVNLPAGERPFRSVIDFIDDGAAAVTAVAERVREEFAQRIGIADLLHPSIPA